MLKERTKMGPTSAVISNLAGEGRVAGKFPTGERKLRDKSRRTEA